MKSLPNIISLLRLLLAPYVLLLAYRGDEKEAAFLFLTLALSDAVDGAIARLFNAKSTLGKLLDPLADKVLLLFGLLSVTIFTEVRANPILLHLLLSRDLFLVGGTILLRRFGFVPEPSLLGKMTTFSVSVTVFVGFLVSLDKDGLFLEAFKWSQAVSVGLVVVSAVDYAIKGVNFLLAKLIIEKR